MIFLRFFEMTYQKIVKNIKFAECLEILASKLPMLWVLRSIGVYHTQFSVA